MTGILDWAGTNKKLDYIYELHLFFLFLFFLLLFY